MERREYVFCEFSQTEVLSNEAWELNSLSICEECWSKKFKEMTNRYAPTEAEKEFMDFSCVEEKDIPTTIKREEV